jgi:ABC-2 type transport system ATP-binding protein
MSRQQSAVSFMRSSDRSVVADADRGAVAVAALAHAGVRIADFSLGQPSLDEVFLALTGHTAEDQTRNGAPTEEEQPV